MHSEHPPPVMSAADLFHAAQSSVNGTARHCSDSLVRQQRPRPRSHPSSASFSDGSSFQQQPSGLRNSVHGESRIFDTSQTQFRPPPSRPFSLPSSSSTVVPLPPPLPPRGFPPLPPAPTHHPSPGAAPWKVTGEIQPGPPPPPPQVPPPPPSSRSSLPSSFMSSGSIPPSMPSRPPSSEVPPWSSSSPSPRESSALPPPPWLLEKEEKDRRRFVDVGFSQKPHGTAPWKKQGTYTAGIEAATSTMDRISSPRTAPGMDPTVPRHPVLSSSSHSGSSSISAPPSEEDGDIDVREALKYAYRSIASPSHRVRTSRETKEVSPNGRGFNFFERINDQNKRGRACRKAAVRKPNRLRLPNSSKASLSRSSSPSRPDEQNRRRRSRSSWKNGRSRRDSRSDILSPPRKSRRRSLQESRDTNSHDDSTVFVSSPKSIQFTREWECALKEADKQLSSGCDAWNRYLVAVKFCHGTLGSWANLMGFPVTQFLEDLYRMSLEGPETEEKSPQDRSTVHLNQTSDDSCTLDITSDDVTPPLDQNDEEEEGQIIDESKDIPSNECNNVEETTASNQHDMSSDSPLVEIDTTASDQTGGVRYFDTMNGAKTVRNQRS